jgi:ribosomal protein S18 acetylase RimI-like enzyme
MDYICGPIYIRLAVPADALEMADIIMRSWEAAYKDIIPAEYIREKNATRPALYKRVITDENTESYVIQYNGKTVGIMRVAAPQDDDMGDNAYELHYIYLHPDFFRMGIGTQAMKFAFNIACRLRKTEMTVWVFAENTNTIKFYEKCGFVPDGKTKIHDMGKSMGSIRMRRGL